jgi:hypothetical protein
VKTLGERRTSEGQEQPGARSRASALPFSVSVTAIFSSTIVASVIGLTVP